MTGALFEDFMKLYEQSSPKPDGGTGGPGETPFGVADLRIPPGGRQLQILRYEAGGGYPVILGAMVNGADHAEVYIYPDNRVEPESGRELVEALLRVFNE